MPRHKNAHTIGDGFEDVHERVVPSHLLPKVPEAGISSEPQQIYSTPATSQSVTDVSIVRIDMPNYGVYDCRDAMLEFDASGSFTTNGTFEVSHIETFIPYDSNAGAALAALQGEFHITLNGRQSRPIAFNATIATIQARIDELAASTNDTQTYVVSGSGMNNVAGITITTSNFSETPNTSGQKPGILNENLSTGVVALDIQQTIDLVGAVSQRSQVAFHNWIGSVFREALVRIGGVEVQEQKEYNLLQNILNEITKFTEYQTKYKQQLGQGTFAQRAAWFASSRYSIPLMTLLYGTKSLPLFCTPGTMQLELHTSQPSLCTEYTGAAPSNVSYTLSNFRWMYDVVRLPKQVHLMIKDRVSGGRSALHFKEYEHYSEVIQAARHQFNVTERAQSITDIIIVMRQDSTVFAASTLDRYRVWQPFGLTNFQVKIGDTYYPAQQTRRGSAANSSELFWNYLKALGNWSSDIGVIKDAGVGTDEYNSNRFFIWWNIDAHKHEDLLGGKNTSKNSTPLLAEFTFEAAQASPIRIDLFVGTDRILAFNEKDSAYLIR